MRIALFSDTYIPQVNGVSHTVHRLAGSFSERGHDVAVFAVSRYGRKEFDSVAHGKFRVIPIPSFPVPAYPGERGTIPFGFALREARMFKPDVVHSHTPFSVGWEAVLSARMLGVPLFGTHHTFFDHYLEHVWLDYRWARTLSWKYTVGYYNRCTAVISPSRSLADGLRERGLTRPVEIIPNAIDTELFHPPADRQSKEAAKTALGVLGGRVLAYMGRVSYEKSIDQVVRTAALVMKKFPETKLLIIGDGPERPALEHLAEELGIRTRITFTGFLHGARLAEALQASDILLTASKSENMPLSILEGMASGLPIIAPAALGLRELIKHNENGFLITPDRPDEMAKRIEELFTNETLAEKFSAASRRLSLGHSPAHGAELHERLYKKFLSNQ